MPWGALKVWFGLPIVECTGLNRKRNVFINKNIVLKKKPCTKNRLLCAITFGKCTRTGAKFVGIYTKKSQNLQYFPQDYICPLFPSLML
jgi:hypothetical protein